MDGTVRSLSSEAFLTLSGVFTPVPEPEPLEGRQIGILIAEGSDTNDLISLIKAVQKAGGHAVIVAAKAGRTRLSDNSAIMAEAQLADSSSLSFDAVAVLLSETGAVQLRHDEAAMHWLRDAFENRKAIGYNPEARIVLGTAGIVPVEGVVPLADLPQAAAQLQKETFRLA